MNQYIAFNEDGNDIVYMLIDDINLKTITKDKKCLKKQRK